jgi:hypothetical protein
MSIGRIHVQWIHFKFIGPLEIFTLPSHRPATSIGFMLTYDAIRPVNICLSIGSNGPLGKHPLPSHRPPTCMESMQTYDVIEWTYLTAHLNV